MQNINRGIIIIPPIIFVCNASPININNNPRYIGFLENTNVPSTTKEDAVFGFNGFTVVLFFLKERAEEMIIPMPTISKTKPE